MADTHDSDQQQQPQHAHRRGFRLLWHRLRTGRYRSLLLYLVFVAIAALFWLVMAMNDSTQASLQVGVKIINIPDSVTFINDPPASIQVKVLDKGTHLLRSGVFQSPAMVVNFKEYARDGVFRFTSADLYSQLRNTFGQSAQISSVSVDSIVTAYTTAPGRRVPIRVDADLTAGVGYVINGKMRISQAYARLYSVKANVDTINYVTTRTIRLKNLVQTRTVATGIVPIPDVKIVPSTVKVTIPVETLVKKRSVVPVHVVGVPQGESLLIFPANVEMTYFVPMSTFNDDDTHAIDVVADYRDIARHSGRIPLQVRSVPANYRNPQLQTDSVEYTIVR